MPITLGIQSGGVNAVRRFSKIGNETNPQQSNYSQKGWMHNASGLSAV
jgi:hypothetical protein